MFESTIFLAYGLDAVAVAYIAATVVSVAASAASAIVSHRQQKEAAKQTEMNAEAQAKAIAMERERKAAELAENQRRMAEQQRRERAAQFSALASTGFVATSGTPLEIMADTIQAQHRDLADLTGDGNLDQWKLGYQSQSLLEEARSSASMQRAQAGATLITGLVGAAADGVAMAANTPTKKTTAKPVTTAPKPAAPDAGSAVVSSSKPRKTLLTGTDYRGSRSY